MILAVQTADATARLWLLQSDAAGSASPVLEWEAGRQLADQLLGRITDTFQQNSVQLSDLAGIVVFSGPGSFTSLRIGHTVANALADSLNIPIAGAQGDDWLAQGIRLLAETPPGRPTLPHYGADANITKPKA